MTSAMTLTPLNAFVLVARLGSVTAAEVTIRPAAR